MPQQFLKRVNVTAEHEVPHGEGMAEDVRADTLPFGQIRATVNALEQHIDTAPRQRRPALAQKHMVFAWIAKLQQSLLIGTITVDIQEQGAQGITTKRDTPLFIALAMHDHHALFPVEVRQAQPT